jgi:DNA-binding transcriptional ArsR family regulator
MTARQDPLDDLFHALADETRRALVLRLAASQGLTTGDLVRTVAHLSRWGVLKHLEVLRRAGLVTTLSEGRRRRHYLDRRRLASAQAWLSRAE